MYVGQTFHVFKISAYVKCSPHLSRRLMCDILTEFFPLPIVVVIVVVVVVLNYSHFLVQNHRANFNNTWQKHPLLKVVK